MKGDDQVWWAPEKIRGTPLEIALSQFRVHICPTAIAATCHSREALDPMALGTCRYCKQPLPE